MRPEKTFFDIVGDFHKKFGLPVAQAPTRCELLDKDTLRYRFLFLQEELTEFAMAADKDDLPGMLDALVDLAWVAMGTAHYMGAPFNDAWAEVTRANMAKVLGLPGDDGHKRGAAEVIRKPPGWQGPRLAQLIDAYNKQLPLPFEVRA